MVPQKGEMESLAFKVSSPQKGQDIHQEAGNYNAQYTLPHNTQCSSSNDVHLQLTCFMHCSRSLVCCMCLSIEFILIVSTWLLPESH